MGSAAPSKNALSYRSEGFEISNESCFTIVFQASSDRQTRDDPSGDWLAVALRATRHVRRDAHTHNGIGFWFPQSGKVSREDYGLLMVLAKPAA